MTRDTSPGRPIEAGTPLSLGLRLLDHQILGREQEMVGNVDDVALEDRDGRLVAVGLLRGPGAWAHRQPAWRVLTAWSCGCGATWSAGSPAPGAATTPSEATCLPCLRRRPTSTWLRALTC